MDLVAEIDFEEFPIKVMSFGDILKEHIRSQRKRPDNIDDAIQATIEYSMKYERNMEHFHIYIDEYPLFDSFSPYDVKYREKFDFAFLLMLYYLKLLYPYPKSLSFWVGCKTANVTKDENKEFPKGTNLPWGSKKIVL